MRKGRELLGFVGSFAVGLFALTSWTAPQSARQEGQRDLRARLQKAFDEAKTDFDAPNLSAGVWIGDEVVLAAWFARDADAPDEALDHARSAPWTFEALSALALLRMADAGKLELSDAVTKHLPQLKFGGKTVTIAQVLTHSSGAPSYADYLETKDEVRDSAAVLSWLGERPLDAEPGSCFVYSESNALIAAAVAEKLAEAPIQKVLQEWVIDAASLQNTAVEVGERVRRPREASFSVSGAPADAASVGRLFGVVDIRTTLDDLARLMRVLEGEFLAESSRATLLAADRLSGGIEAPYSYGLSRTRLESEPFLSLGGASRESALRVSWRPATSLVVASAAGRESVNLARINERLARVVFEIPERKVVDLPLTKEQCAVYTGVYYMGCTRTTIEVRDEQLFFQSPYDGPYRLRYQGEHRFVSEPDDEVIFEFKVDSGVASEFVLNRHGARTGAMRMK